MLIRFVLIVFVLCSACQSGLIPCPDPDSVRYREARIKKSWIKRRTSQPSYLASAREKQLHDYYVNLKSEKRDTKDPATIEEWDCPRPGAQNINKTAKENRRLMEKKMKNEVKKKKKTESTDTVSTAHPVYLEQ